MHASLCFAVAPGNHLALGDAHKMVARALDGEDELAEKVLHLEKSTAGPRYRKGLSPFRCGRLSPTRFAIYAVGTDASIWLIKNQERLGEVIAARLPTVGSKELLAGECTVDLESGYRHYFIADLVWQRHSRHDRELAARQHPAAANELSRVISERMPEWIGRQCDLLGLDLPEALFVSSVNIESGFPTEVHGRFYHTVRLTFATNAVFRGPWHLGHLATRGYGLVKPARRVFHAAA